MYSFNCIVTPNQIKLLWCFFFLSKFLFVCSAQHRILVNTQMKSSSHQLVTTPDCFLTYSPAGPGGHWSSMWSDSWSWQPWLVSQPFAYSFVFLLHVLLSILWVPWLGLCLQPSRQLTGWWRVWRMRGCSGSEEEQGRGTNEGASSSRGLSLCLQIKAHPSPFDFCPEWPGRSVSSLWQLGGGGLLVSCFCFSYFEKTNQSKTIVSAWQRTI